MAKNTYREDTLSVGRKNEVRGKNEPRRANVPKGEKPKKPKRNWKPSFKLPSLNIRIGFLQDRRFKLAAGFTFLLFSFFLTIAFVSYLFTGNADQSVVETVSGTGLKESGQEAENWLGLFGAWLSHLFMYDLVGIGAFFIIPVLFFSGLKIVFKRVNVSLSYVLGLCSFSMLWLSLTMGYIVFASGTVGKMGFLGGGIGIETAIWLNSLIGWGSWLLLGFLLTIFLVFFFNITSINWGWGTKTAEQPVAAPQENYASSLGDVMGASTRNINHNADPTASLEEEEEEYIDEEVPFDEDEEEEIDRALEMELSTLQPKEEKKEEKPAPAKPATPALELDIDLPEDVLLEDTTAEAEDDMALQIEEVPEEEESRGTMENYDPTLDLARYQYPHIELLTDYGINKIQVSKEELEANKDKIVETLGHYNISIANIKATIGPTVTLYEIVPDAGVRISKIKNLEDDIALSLAALGIRIIAPIPGKGTIGIEVPNTKKEMVPIKSILATEKFSKSDMDLPIAFGKTITNEVFITDLAKMPHLLMAGATGQGKSVGLNAILTSLLYKRHPSQLKFVLVDPKKVELSLFNKIERHFLAKLPDSDEAIITDTKKVVNTLNSLCMEMDMRYDLLKDAGCRNLKEYNRKFVERKLNPKKGHRFMPYIVLVIDELADLMMTAGKEVETPIARLAQLARAIGIHLVVATQRPSVNVITGIIKANFPARISFKVTSKIDSRTILDAGGADQLIGQGDMLFSIGSDMIRIQCAFVDTPEVDRICEFIGEQQGYDDAYLLPEFVGDESGNEKADFDPSNRDPLFEEAARVIVQHQQGSTSLLQRRLKLGYNRAGRLIDQLESAGIVGPFEGSKAREVLIPDEYSLEQLLNTIE
ncbi:S-DNA-T family DNA segregation ATPase FtsK/SpoIIIE [Pontibacter ummariensis]|uniref:DNA segregation ATPase FtsK/SpoIIIE, S-DNA-T family n=1 Tax=Pontibacter ummariensis TaxID=1610492 RepID=A0A239EI94_9BACT|nr:DNA translocase FtsK [Pontibacter ummariensis]PRY13242.1 S-DNA-T family DNA segregation ATPase FtsK/SpoIIIE [Pontibacter ummariensis]SNS43604.1 DNA segregation ATPase FtsK/SpoIIIE, S-DNA-T family [Pontibacter ummariensis]